MDATTPPTAEPVPHLPSLRPSQLATGQGDPTQGAVPVQADVLTAPTALTAPTWTAAPTGPVTPTRPATDETEQGQLSPPGAKRPRRPRHRAKGGPFTTEQIVCTALSVIGVAVAMAFVWLQLQPGLLLRDSLAAGGDMGAHVWGPDYLRREILPNFSLSGWTKDWYAGFPAYRFYMVVPALLVVLLDLVPFVPYTVAFKLVTVSGLVTMPLAAWFMGRMFRLRYPGPALLAFGTLPFIFDFDERFRIIGGNAASTLAGEFSFSISLSLCLVYLGVAARGLETGRYRAWGAVLFSLVLLNHLIPAMFAVVATLLLGLLRLAIDARKPGSWLLLIGFVGSVAVSGWAGYTDRIPSMLALALPVLALGLLIGAAYRLEPAWRSTLYWVAPAGVAGALLSGFWALPFLQNRALFNDMGWERLQTYRDYLGPAKSLTIVWYAVFALSLVAVVLSIVNRELIGAFLASCVVTMGVLFAVWPDTQMWNARFLPFYYLSLYLLAAVGLALFINELPSFGLRSLGGTIAAVGLLFAGALPLGMVPGSKLVDGQHSFYGLVDAPQSIVDDWARWNYSGYEGKKDFPEYEAVVQAMAEVGREQGCGRAMWEYQTEKLNSYGTPMALMLLPYWTKGCIGSMEGLYFESSATTPYHFMNQSELSEAPSRAQRDLPYSALDVGKGVQHMQLMGVRYYMALTEAAKTQANNQADLRYLRSSGPWDIYEVANSTLVQALDNQPAVLADIGGTQDDWLEPSAAYYNDPSRWNVALAASGPAEWDRVELGSNPTALPVAPVTVSAIEEGSDWISFDVDQIGTPVLVKTSYFPNWKVDGAKGPYRVMPNLMVVIPTERHVSLKFGRSGADWAGIGLSLLGLAAVVAMARAKPLTLRRVARPGPWGTGINTPAQLDVSRYLLAFPDGTGWDGAGSEPSAAADPSAWPAPSSGVPAELVGPNYVSDPGPDQALWGPPRPDTSAPGISGSDASAPGPVGPDTVEPADHGQSGSGPYR